MMDIRQIARALGGEVSGGQALVPGPGHGRNDRSLAVRIGQTGKVIVCSFANDDWRECRDYVLAKLGLRGPEIAPVRPIVTGETEDPSRPGNAARAACIWQESTDPHGTLAEKYLRGRALELPQGCSRFMRFHKSCPFGQVRFPALVALIRSIETDAAQAIQRTALNCDGTAIMRNGKTLRMSLGPMAGGAVKIDDPAETLCIGEGFESALAGRQMGYAPAWALLSAGGIAKLPLLPRIKSLTIFCENDEAGRKATHECGKRWHESGREVTVVEPRFGADLNDAILSGRMHA
jgi:putative DNA primase/helicase